MTLLTNRYLKIIKGPGYNTLSESLLSNENCKFTFQKKADLFTKNYNSRIPSLILDLINEENKKILYLKVTAIFKYTSLSYIYRFPFPDKYDKINSNIISFILSLENINLIVIYDVFTRQGYVEKYSII